MNAVRYMAGYVVDKLQKKLGKEEVEKLIETNKTTIQDSNVPTLLIEEALFMSQINSISWSWQ